MKMSCQLLVASCQLPVRQEKQKMRDDDRTVVFQMRLSFSSLATGN